MATPPKINGDKMRQLINASVVDNGQAINLVAEILVNLTDADTPVFHRAGTLLKVLRSQQENLYTAQSIIQINNSRKRPYDKGKKD